MMYSDVVMEKRPESNQRRRRHSPPARKIDGRRQEREKIYSDTELTAEDLKNLCAAFKKQVKKVLGKEFPDNPVEQLWGGIGAVFASWNGKRAVAYRRIEGIPDEWGTAWTVQAMYLAIWVKTAPPVWLSAVILVAVKMVSTVNTGNAQGESCGWYPHSRAFKQIFDF
jgi:hypothetical protein